MREVQSCQCAEYGEEPRLIELFGHEYCRECQPPYETDWWGEISVAQRAAWMLWGDLRGRRGFKQPLDHETENSIIEDWVEIIKAAMNGHDYAETARPTDPVSAIACASLGKKDD